VIQTGLFLLLLAAPIDAGATSGWRPIAMPIRAAATRDSVLRLLRQGRTEEAESLLGKALAQGEPDAELGIMWGRVLIQMGNLSGAEAAFRLVLEAFPDHGAALAGLCEVFARDPSSWDRRSALQGFLRDAILRLHALGTEESMRQATTVELGLADFERAVGLNDDARARLLAISARNLLPEQRRLLGTLRERLERDEQVRALESWPDPPVAPSAQVELAEAQGDLTKQNAARALAKVDALLVANSTWKEALRLRAQALVSLGRHDDAMAALESLTRLAPTDAQTWRLLGQLLARMGGRSDMELARLALNRALALEPGYSDLWLPRAQVSLRLGDLESARVALLRHRANFPENTADPVGLQLESLLKRAQAEQRTQGKPQYFVARRIKTEAAEKLAQARAWLAGGDPAGLAAELLADALAMEPGYADAAITLYTLDQNLPTTTAKALWNSGEDLLQLSLGVLSFARNQAGADQTGRATLSILRKQVSPWIDRAVELGAGEALFDRARLRHERGERETALSDLARYVALRPAPTRLNEALSLRAALSPTVGSTDAQISVLLLADRTQDARSLVGGRCRQERSSADLARLARIDAFEGDLPAATECLRMLLEPRRKLTPDEHRHAQVQLVSIAIRTTPQTRQELVPYLEQAVVDGLKAAHLPLAEAKLARRTGPRHGDADVVEHLKLFLSADDAAIGRIVPPETIPALREKAERLRVSLHTSREAEIRRYRNTGIGIAGLTILVVVWRLRRRFHGVSVQDALAREPHLFPEIADEIAQLRHDVLKHRASNLSALAATAAASEIPWEALRETFLQPTPTSQVVAEAHARLEAVAKGRGLVLRRLQYDPILGRLYRDLAAAELLLQHDHPSAKRLAAIDLRLRGMHFERLTQLLAAGPVTRIDASSLDAWVRAISSEYSDTTIPTALFVSGDNLKFPLPHDELYTAVSNLLRNAFAASAATPGDPDASIVIRVAREHDDLGRTLLTLRVGDTVKAPLTMIMIDTRPADRGLGIVNEVVKRWRGQIELRREVAPWTKSVALCFPERP
jgi:tetratricopeptide (TPR) repeat protein